MLKIVWKCKACEMWNKSSVKQKEVLIIEDEESPLSARCVHCGERSLLDVKVKSVKNQSPPTLEKRLDTITRRLSNIARNFVIIKGGKKHGKRPSRG